MKKLSLLLTAFLLLTLLTPIKSEAAETTSINGISSISKDCYYVFSTMLKNGDVETLYADIEKEKSQNGLYATYQPTHFTIAGNDNGNPYLLVSYMPKNKQTGEYSHDFDAEYTYFFKYMSDIGLTQAGIDTSARIRQEGMSSGGTTYSKLFLDTTNSKFDFVKVSKYQSYSGDRLATYTITKYGSLNTKGEISTSSTDPIEANLKSKAYTELEWFELSDLDNALKKLSELAPEEETASTLDKLSEREKLFNDPTCALSMLPCALTSGNLTIKKEKVDLYDLDLNKTGETAIITKYIFANLSESEWGKTRKTDCTIEGGYYAATTNYTTYVTLYNDGTWSNLVVDYSTRKGIGYTLEVYLDPCEHSARADIWSIHGMYFYDKSWKDYNHLNMHDYVALFTTPTEFDASKRVIEKTEDIEDTEDPSKPESGTSSGSGSETGSGSGSETPAITSIKWPVPKSATEYNGHYYKVYKATSTWEEAKETCEKNGGHLVTISNADENTFLWTLVRSEDRYIKHCWIGASGNMEDGYKWVTGEKMKYTNWGYAAMHSKKSTTGNTFYAEFDKGNTWAEKEKPEFTSQAYICEWDIALTAKENNISLKVKDTVKLDPVLTCGDLVISNAKYTYSSSNQKIARVSSSGQVIAKGEGVCTITISSKGLKTTVLVRVGKNAVTNVKQIGSSKSSVKLSWKAVNGVTGYEIWMYDKDFKQYKLVKKVSAKSTEATIKKLNSKKSYKFKIRAYTTYNSKKIYAPYSKVFIAKTK